MNRIPESIQKRIDHELLMAKETEDMAKWADGGSYAQDMDTAKRRRELAERLKIAATKDTEASRKRDLAMIHVGAKAIGMNLDDYRAMLFRISGRRSAGDLIPSERQAVLAELKRMGWNERRPSDGKQFQGGDQLAFLRYLWERFSDAGKAKIPGEPGLCRWLNARFKVQKPEWLNPTQRNAAIGALKDMISRPVSRGSMR